MYTTFDPKAQADAEQAVELKTPDTDGRYVSALAAVEPGNGKVRALVGGPLGGENQFNAATREPGRQPGSSFKPFVLATAFSQGRVPNDTISGQGPCSFNNPGGYPNPYVVSNYDGSGGSTTSLKEQTIQSNNCAFVRLGQRVGQQKVVDFAKKLGVDGLDANISLPLGTEEITPLKMAAAYAAFAADGQYNAPYLVERVENAQGQEIVVHQAAPSTAMTPEVARWVTDVLQSNVERGTGTKARIWGQQVAGKTGTTQDYGDAWFVGYSPYMATAVWMGNPKTNGDKMRSVGGIKVTGGSYPSEIWQAFMSRVHADLPQLSFPPAPSRVLAAASADCPNPSCCGRAGGWDWMGLCRNSSPCRRSTPKPTSCDTGWPPFPSEPRWMQPTWRRPTQPPRWRCLTNSVTSWDAT
ncbi:MAG: hypothetical protein IPG03_03320 [Candidatus Microthrix sp.]|nr:penicillin-binding transpeptidase domain-containing protein [Candidatus Microthrix sp.]MBK6501420.1 hypothetical protein [Candidatus Microthrix sp.]